MDCGLDGGMNTFKQKLKGIMINILCAVLAIASIFWLPWWMDMEEVLPVWIPNYVFFLIVYFVGGILLICGDFIASVIVVYEMALNGKNTTASTAIAIVRTFRTINIVFSSLIYQMLIRNRFSLFLAVVWSLPSITAIMMFDEKETKTIQPILKAIEQGEKRYNIYAEQMAEREYALYVAEIQQLYEQYSRIKDYELNIVPFLDLVLRIQPESSRDDEKIEKVKLEFFEQIEMETEVFIKKRQALLNDEQYERFKRDTDGRYKDMFAFRWFF